MRQYMNIINETALNELSEGSSAKSELTRMVRARVMEDSKTHSAEDILRAVHEAARRVAAMSPEETAAEMEKHFGSKKTEAEPVLNEFFGWEHIIGGYVILFLYCIWARVNVMVLVHIIILSVEVALSIPYIVLKKLFMGRDFSVYRFIDDRVRSIGDDGRRRF